MDLHIGTQTCFGKSWWGAFSYKGRKYVPDPLSTEVINLFNIHPKSGYYGISNTRELVSRDRHQYGMYTME
jgi:hypothetical protein